MTGNLTSFKRWEDLSAHLAERAASVLGTALGHRGRAVLALSGGATPNRYLPPLRAAPLDWDRIDVTLIDERFVPVEHADSNEGLVGRHGFVPTVGLRGSAAAPEEAAQDAAARLSAIPLPWDMAIYGVGPDGHIASLFPGTALPAEAPLCIATKAPDGRDRLSMSPLALTRFAHPILVIGGAKLAVLERAEAEQLPVRLLLAQPALEILHCTAED